MYTLTTMPEEIEGADVVPSERKYEVPETGKIFIPSVGIISIEDAKKEAEDELVGGIFVGQNFTVIDLDKIQENITGLRREDLASSQDLTLYNESIVNKIERKLKIREALKTKGI